MCGIAGIVTAEGPASADEIGRMTSLVEYRGPDDFGYLGYNTRGKHPHFTKEIGELAPGGGREYDLLLGHRRLAILDLSEQGRCPMPSADGRLWITYNGEIYNYIELRAELSVLGHGFSTGTDTEVILAASSGRTAVAETFSQKNSMNFTATSMGVQSQTSKYVAGVSYLYDTASTGNIIVTASTEPGLGSATSTTVMLRGVGQTTGQVAWFCGGGTTTPMPAKYRPSSCKDF